MRGHLRRWFAGLAVLACAAGLLLRLGTPAAVGATTPRFLTDAQGRALILYGLNTDDVPVVAGASRSAAPASPSSSASASASWSSSPSEEYGLLGDDCARILLHWSSVEPTPGRYDDVYLAALVRRIGQYAAVGDHVVLAMTQDAFGPTPGAASVPAAVNSARIHAADEFWHTRDDAPDLQDRYAAAWAHIASYLAAHLPRGAGLLSPADAVVGFDLLDRPWGGSVQGPAFETGALAAFYERVIARVRAVDQDHWLFVEPEAASADTGLPSALPYLPDPRHGVARIGYAPQLYPAPVDPDGNYSGSDAFWTDRLLNSWAIQVTRTAKRLDAPVLVGGWGADFTAPGAHLYVDHVQELLDDLMAGSACCTAAPGPWSPWQKPGKGADIAGVLQTAYPRAIAGTPVEFDYDKGTLVFTLQFRDEAAVIGPTEVYLPPSDFPLGPQIDFDSEYTSTWDPARHILSLTVTRPTPGTVHTLRLTPASPSQNVG
ncbi:cellulase family glycosylhydrolase [Streptacidiphilus anmyonensis]|uniref:cellulase family glycosylhydrolase n=1 Tax=Streptacidiphilus anmyonensis TaxID=405782 RepID=UPI0005A899F2|nr:cellulase family glycosylhydrolase [Streptacidiphilus anmyonensis]